MPGRKPTDIEYYFLTLYSNIILQILPLCLTEKYLNQYFCYLALANDHTYPKDLYDFHMSFKYSIKEDKSSYVEIAGIKDSQRSKHLHIGCIL